MAFELVYWFTLIFFTSVSSFQFQCDLKKFQTSNIAPTIIPTVPEGQLLVEYNKKKVECGNTMTRAETKDHPTVVDFTADPKKLYTFIMFDPDTSTPQRPDLANYRHWLVENVPGSLVQNGDLVTSYDSPAPPAHSDAHRYIFLVYEQPKKLQDEFENWKRTHFNLKKFVKDRGLKGPIAGNFFYLKY